MRVDVHINGGISDADMKEAMETAIVMTSEQALGHCNKYCKMDTGALIESSNTHSDFKKGELKWVEPYAEKQYKLPAAHRDKNALATSEWCQVAEANYGDKWQATFKQAYERGLHR